MKMRCLILSIGLLLGSLQPVVVSACCDSCCSTGCCDASCDDQVACYDCGGDACCCDSCCCDPCCCPTECCNCCCCPVECCCEDDCCDDVFWIGNVGYGLTKEQKAACDELCGYEGSELYTAILNGDTEKIKKLVESGVDVNTKIKGVMPMVLAVRYKQVEVIKLLESHGAHF